MQKLVWAISSNAKLSDLGAQSLVLEEWETGLRVLQGNSDALARSENLEETRQLMGLNILSKCEINLG